MLIYLLAIGFIGSITSKYFTTNKIEGEKVCKDCQSDYKYTYFSWDKEQGIVTSCITSDILLCDDHRKKVQADSCIYRYNDINTENYGKNIQCNVHTKNGTLCKNLLGRCRWH